MPKLHPVTMEERPCKNLFFRALLDLGEMHDKEVQALREQLRARPSFAPRIKGLRPPAVEAEDKGWREVLTALPDAEDQGLSRWRLITEEVPPLRNVQVMEEVRPMESGESSILERGKKCSKRSELSRNSSSRQSAAVPPSRLTALAVTARASMGAMRHVQSSSRMEVLSGVLNLDLTAQENSSARRQRVKESVLSEEVLSGTTRRLWSDQSSKASSSPETSSTPSRQNVRQTIRGLATRGWRSSELYQASSFHSLQDSRAFKVKLTACKKIMGMQVFDALCSLMIISHSVLMGFMADWRVRNFGEPRLPESFTVLDRLFTSWFLLELLLRICGHGLEFFVHPKHWMWNLFDLCVVTADVVNMLIDLASPQESTDAGGEILLVRLLRVLRITRALLIVRIFRFFRELRMMVSSVLRSGTSLIWSIALFVLNLFLFAVFFTGQLAAYKKDQLARGGEADETADAFFGSMASAVFTLFLSVTGGISWVEVITPLKDVHWSNSLVFSFFIFFTLFALTNIITGIFVDTAIQSAQSDRDEVIQTQLHKRYDTLQQMKEILEEADTDGDGSITLRDLEEHLNNKRIRAHMEALGLQLEEARELFRLLDTSKAGVVAVDEFIFGCMRLKGSARAIDLATLMYENKRMFEMLNNFFEYVETEFDKIGPFLASLDLQEVRGEHSEDAFASQGSESGPTAVFSTHSMLPG